MAQTPESGEEPPPPPVYDMMLSFYVWQVRGILTDATEMPGLPTVYLRGADGVRKVPLARGAQTPPLRYTAETPPVLFRGVPVENPEAGAPRMRAEVVAELAVPADWDRALVLLFPERTDGQGRWTAGPVWNPTLELPDGGVLLVNSTPGPLVVEVEGDGTPLGAGRTLLVQGDDLPDRFRLRAYGRDRQNRPRLVHTSKQLRRQGQGNVLIFYPTSAERVRVLSLRDLEPPPTPTPAPVER
jgi:hypothetical protein